MRRRLTAAVATLALGPVTLLDVTPAAAAAPPGIVTGPGFGAGAHVRVFDANAQLSTEWLAPDRGAGARVATGNLDGAGAEEVIVEFGTRAEPAFAAYRLDGSVFASPPQVVVDCVGPGGRGFGPCPRSPGRPIASGDVDGDGRDEIVTGAAPGDAALVTVWRYEDNAIRFVASFDAYPGFTGGVHVAVGDTDGSGRDEIITGADSGGGPHVRVFEVSASGAANEEAGFFAFAAAFGGGVRVASANLDTDTAEEIVAAAGPGGGPHVRVFDGNGAPTPVGFYAYAAEFNAGVYVAAGDADGDARNEIVTGPGAGGGPHVRMFERDGAPTAVSFFAYPVGMNAGVHPAVLARTGQSTNTGGNSSSQG